MLKETPRSLAQYFGLMSIFCLLGMLVTYFNGGGVSTFRFWYDAAWAVVYGYIALRLPGLLLHPTPIKAVLIVNALSSLVFFILSLRTGITIERVAILAISLLIFVYLYRSVTRLSKEAYATPITAP